MFLALDMVFQCRRQTVGGRGDEVDRALELEAELPKLGEVSFAPAQRVVVADVVLGLGREVPWGHGRFRWFRATRQDRCKQAAGEEKLLERRLFRFDWRNEPGL